MTVLGCSALSTSSVGRLSTRPRSANDYASAKARVRVRAGGWSLVCSGVAPSSSSAPRQQQLAFLSPRHAPQSNASRSLPSSLAPLLTANPPSSQLMRGFGRRALSAVAAAVSRTKSIPVSVDVPAMFSGATTASLPATTAAAALAARTFDGSSTATQSRRCSVVAAARRARRDDTALTNIHNVGKVSAAVLSDVGIPDIPTLKNWYSLRETQDSEVVVETLCKLKGSNGSLRVTAARALVKFLEKDGSMEEEKAEERTGSAIIDPGAGRGLTVCVEGNIGVGKTTFLQKLIGQSLELQEVVEVVPEPVEEWQDVGNDHVNLLDLFYQDQQRYAYTFQHYVFVTRVMQEKKSREQLERGPKTLRMLERSVFSDRMVFVRAVHEARCMSDVELNVYDSWFSPMVNALPTLVPDGFIYLRADPTTCLNRMNGRGRDEEGGIDISYLESLHTKHEDWLNSGSNTPFISKDILLPKSQSGAPQTLGFSPVNTPALPEVLRGKIIHLDRSDMASLNSVPALVLDYNTNIDIENDVEAQREYVKQVVAYKDYLMSYRSGLLVPSKQPIVPSTEFQAMASGVQLRN